VPMGQTGGMGGGGWSMGAGVGESDMGGGSDDEEGSSSRSSESSSQRSADTRAAAAVGLSEFLD
jgi:hypothetical protein